MHGIYAGFFRKGEVGRREHWPVVLSQMLLFVIKCVCFLCIDEKTKRLSS